MTRDEARKILGEEATEEQITNFLGAIHQTEKQKNDEIAKLKEQSAKYSDYDDIKRQLNEINQSQMTEQEKIDKKLQEAEQKLQEAEQYKKSSQKIYNTAKVKEILAGENVNEKIIARLVTDDEQETIENAMLFKQERQELRNSIEKQTKESLLNTDLKPTMTNVNQNENDVMTIEKFGNLSAAEQEKILLEHPDLFKQNN